MSVISTADHLAYIELARLFYNENHETLLWKLFRYIPMSQSICGNCDSVFPGHSDMDE
jgi:hypothetical protein